MKKEKIIKGLFTLAMTMVVFSLTGCRTLKKVGTTRYIEIKADLKSFDRIELVKGNIEVFKNIGEDAFFVKNKVTGDVYQITEQNIYNYIIWGDKITELSD